jgi:hypothetical protein
VSILYSCEVGSKVDVPTDVSASRPLPSKAWTRDEGSGSQAWPDGHASPTYPKVLDGHSLHTQVSRHLLALEHAAGRLHTYEDT